MKCLRWQPRALLGPLTTLLVAACGGGAGGGDAGDNDYTVGGAVEGLSGTLVLQNNGGDDLTVPASGPFTFPTALEDGATYLVTVKSQPEAQTCTASNHSGTIRGAKVTDVAVACSTRTYTIAGAVSGLAGTVVLQNNGGDDLVLEANGPFTFATPAAHGAGYAVTVKSQPLGQTCTASNNSGTVTANVTDVSVVCSVNHYTIGGTLSGLAGTVVLQNNGGDDLVLQADGPFTFATPVAHGGGYAVTVKDQPVGQTCTATANSGTAVTANVTDVSVACSVNHYGVGGTLSGLAGTIVLQNNATDDLVLQADGPFTFATPVTHGAAYEVTVKTPPAGQQCFVANGSGAATSAVSGVDVQCLTTPKLTAVAQPKAVKLTWSDTGATSYDVYYSTDPTCDLATVEACPGGGGQAGVTSPFLATGLANDTHYTFWLRASHASGHSLLAKSGARPGRLGADDVIYAAAIGEDGTVYLGGRFSLVGAANGGGGPLYTDTVGTAPHPVILGEVRAAVSDGAGGYYVGGHFARVGGVARANLVHVLPDGSVDPTWSADTDGDVLALALSGSTLYAGGWFNTVGGQSRLRLVALDATTGAVKAGFTDVWGTVYALAVSGDTLYVGGDFPSAAGQPRTHLAAYDTATGDLLPWDPQPDREVTALVAAGDRVYVGGEFENLGFRLAALDATSGAVATWADADATINAIRALALSADGRTLYVGGDFYDLGDEPRRHIAALDVTTGLATAWDPNASRPVDALAVVGDIVYAGGEFSTIGGQTRHRLAALDATASDGAATDWTPDPIGAVHALAPGNGTIYAGGALIGFGAEVRNAAAAITPEGTLSPWNPDVKGALYRGVYAIAATTDTVYLGGWFNNVGGQSRSNIAAVGIDGAVTDWSPVSNDDVYALAVDGSTVYAGGYFTHIGFKSRSRLAALDATTGQATSWNPSVGNGWVNAMAVKGSTVYFGGEFSSVSGQPRTNLAAVDAAGTLLAWSATVIDPVNALAADDTALYVGTYGVAAFSLADGSAVAGWGSMIARSVDGLALAGSTLYAVSTYSSWPIGIVGVLSAIDVNGPTVTWNLEAGDINCVAANGGAVYVGGEFRHFDGEPAGGFAIIQP